MWQDIAVSMYRVGMKIGDIADEVKKDRKTVRKYLAGIPSAYVSERNDKKEADRLEYKKEWDRKNRNSGIGLDKLFISARRQHIIDVQVLSSEKF